MDASLQKPDDGQTAAGNPRTAKRRAIEIIVGTLVVLALHYPLWSAWRTTLLLEREGVQVEGLVTDLRAVPHRRNTSYHIDYSYRFDGQQYAESEEIDSSVYYRNSIGAPITLTVARSDPETVSVGADAGLEYMKMIYAGCYGLLAVASLLWIVPWVRGKLRGGRSA
jgi:hypothetical protein